MGIHLHRVHGALDLRESLVPASRLARPRDRDILKRRIKYAAMNGRAACAGQVRDPDKEPLQRVERVNDRRLAERLASVAGDDKQVCTKRRRAVGAKLGEVPSIGERLEAVDGLSGSINRPLIEPLCVREVSKIAALEFGPLSGLTSFRNSLRGLHGIRCTTRVPQYVGRRSGGHRVAVGEMCEALLPHGGLPRRDAAQVKRVIANARERARDQSPMPESVASREIGTVSP